MLHQHRGGVRVAREDLEKLGTAIAAEADDTGMDRGMAHVINYSLL